MVIYHFRSFMPTAFTNKPRMTKLGQGVGVRAHYPTLLISKLFCLIWSRDSVSTSFIAYTGRTNYTKAPYRMSIPNISSWQVYLKIDMRNVRI